MPTLELPFTYDALVLPTPRHRIAHKAILRGYTPVLVPEIGQDDLSPAIEISENGATSLTLYRYRDKLLRQAKSSATGQPLGWRELEFSLSQRDPETADGAEPRPTDFDIKHFPYGRNRSGFSWAMEDGTCPMSRNPLTQETAHRGWRHPIVRKSTEVRERGWAQHYYSAALVVADGIAFVECPEPVYELRSWPRPQKLDIRTNPTMSMASRSFRLDERHLAEAWAEECGVRVDEDLPGVRLLNDGSLTRDSIYELAVSAITPLRRLWFTTPNVYEDGEAAGLLEKLGDGRLSIESWEVPLLLETVGEILRLAVINGTYHDDRGDWRRLKAIVERWKWEIGQGLDIDRYLRFSDADLAALEELPDW